jgi:hypothetical protein
MTSKQAKSIRSQLRLYRASDDLPTIAQIKRGTLADWLAEIRVEMAKREVKP